MPTQWFFFFPTCQRLYRNDAVIVAQECAWCIVDFVCWTANCRIVELSNYVVESVLSGAPAPVVRLDIGKA